MEQLPNDLAEVMKLLRSTDAELKDVDAFESDKNEEIKSLTRRGALRDRDRAQKIVEAKQLRDIAPFKREELQHLRSELEAHALALQEVAGRNLVALCQREFELTVTAMAPVLSLFYLTGESDNEKHMAEFNGRSELAGMDLARTFQAVASKIGITSGSWTTTTAYEREEILKETQAFLSTSLERRREMLIRIKDATDAGMKAINRASKQK